ncbi:hypothetical protein Bca52824_046395 [Brassica carinata]|uniref:Uncharacterized protein n=1 Tax=Brassica carinata TaxID=52824 RepID=A0A8X7USE7_BRACI|nr:hypothetical protein Bca52824_046395 [Brassica carinata]
MKRRKKIYVFLTAMQIERVHEDGSVVFQNGKTILADVLPFHLFELQSKWIAGVLSGRITLPSKKDMMGEIKIIYDTLEAQGVPKRYTHYLGLPQFEYFDWLDSQRGCSGTEKWRKEMCLTSLMRKMAHPETYRDEWEDHHLRQCRETSEATCLVVDFSERTLIKVGKEKVTTKIIALIHVNVTY